MAFILLFTAQANKALADSKRDNRKYRKIVGCLAKIEQDPAYPGLHTHAFDAIKGALGEKVWESYVENNTPSAWRVWWYYGPLAGEITIYDIGPYP
jgi:hypothetical protein